MSFMLASQQPSEKTPSHSVARKTQASGAATNKYFDGTAATRLVEDAPVPDHAPRYSYRLGSINIFPKLTVNDPGDRYEQEADRVAEQVMSTAATELSPGRAAAVKSGSLQRKCASCEEEDERTLHRKETGAACESAPPIVQEVVRSPGRPLDSSMRAFMEPRFEHDFARVRVHTDERAASSARAINALAYTAGEDIVFGGGQHRPETQSGRQLLAHELAHVVQQHARSAIGGSTLRRKPTPKTDEQKRIEEHERKHAKERKKGALALHKKQQERVILFLDDALDTKPDPAKGPLDPDNLFHNTAELLESGKMVLTVLSPTDYSDIASPVYFDETVKHPNIGGDYPDNPAARDSRTITPPTPGAKGQTLRTQPERMSIVTMPKVEGGGPAKEPPPLDPDVPRVIEWSAAEVRLYAGDTPITKGEVKNVFVHEGQHVADWSYLKGTKPGSWQQALGLYETEFRAFWVQPPIPQERAVDIIRDVPFPRLIPLSHQKSNRKSRFHRARGVTPAVAPTLRPREASRHPLPRRPK